MQEIEITEKIGQIFIIGIEGETLLEKEIRFIIDNNIGGVILFSRNLKSPEQIFNLCQDLQKLKNEMKNPQPLFIGIDMEGGRVHRLKSPFTQWPSFQKLSEKKSLEQTFNFAQAMGLELQTCGVNLNFSPCVDVLTNSKNELIGDRSFGSDPEVVAQMARAIIEGFSKSNIISCAKHFPGHGNTVIDSHKDLPTDDTTLDTLLKRELIPFEKLILSQLDMIMTAHIKYKKIDNDHPATFSQKIINEILRKKLNYKGLIISDDLDMQALTNYHKLESIPLKALRAGCDILLYCNKALSPIKALEVCKKALTEKNSNELQKRVNESYGKVLKLKKKIIENKEFKPEIIGSERHQNLAQEIRN